ncbi:MAG TPA: presqualene diphosphate synthase HpnD [Stellaceae bacterium]|jgi:phytoene synthase|nr:presqualene diphosphate synthase HpnD [Stellaceae bacterium]
MTSLAIDEAAPLDDGALRDLIRRRVEAAGTSFYWAMRLLPQARRDGMYAVYAFCREVDDIADDLPTLAEKQAGLAMWRDEIAALYTGTPRHPVARALREPVARFALRRGDFEAVIDGMEMDAVADIRAPDLATLDTYCGRVAGAVGHLSVHVFGDSGDEAHRVADALGRALQLTNILRDLDEDARRGRLYLPREMLDRHGIRTGDPTEVLRHPALPAVCRDLAEIAERHFAEAERAMALCSRRAMRPAAVMGAFYHAMLRALVAAGWRDPATRVSLSKPRKLWLVLRHGIV